MARSGVKEDHTASFFSHDNAEATRRRDQLAADSLDMLIQWLHNGGNVGIHGACRIHPYYPVSSDIPVRRYEQHEGAKVRLIQVSPKSRPADSLLHTELLLSDGWPKRKG
jgi:hypothetical protein